MKFTPNQSHVHFTWLLYVILVATLSLFLGSCGRPDVEVTMAGATATVGALSQTDMPTQTDIPFELDATKEAAKLAEIAREFNEQATAAAQFANSSPVPFPGIPTTEPYLETVKTGLTIDCKEDYPHELSSTNCWLGALNGQYVSVHVGASKRDLSQGLLIVQTSTLDGTSSTPSAFYTPPTPTGAITITQVVGEHVALIAENGAKLAFNLATRAWEDPSTVPTATPAMRPTSTPLPPATPAPVACTLYPIALHADTLQGVVSGSAIKDMLNGSGTGNFGWLTWSGDQSANALAKSLVMPGDSTHYTNPNDATDHTLGIGDSVTGSTGASNSRALRDALDALKGQTISVPVWDTTSGQGATLRYHIVGFAQVQISAYQVNGQGRISVVYQGAATCAG